jgi:beta-lactamase superfamily II metal-dependent hydrolase
MDYEIELLPVGDASKAGDAIVIRYGKPDSWWLMTIDGGNLDSGEQTVSHIKSAFGQNAYINHAVLTHCDADHASGLREIIKGIRVDNLWLNLPWSVVPNARQYFADKTATNDQMIRRIAKEYDIIQEIVSLAQERKIPIHSAYAGTKIGPFTILSPHQSFYTALVPQFDRTPDADQKAIEAASFWIGKEPNSFLRKLAEAVVTKAQKYITETWEIERLRDGGITSPTNESSVVLYGDFEDGRPALLTGDAGVWGLALSAWFAEQNSLPLRAFRFVQVPHHGSRRNVGPTILNRLIGPILPAGSKPTYSACVSAPKEDDQHPRLMVLNAFWRRGGRVMATQGEKLVISRGFPARGGYSDAKEIPFATKVEDYD